MARQFRQHGTHHRKDRAWREWHTAWAKRAPDLFNEIELGEASLPCQAADWNVQIPHYRHVYHTPQSTRPCVIFFVRANGTLTFHCQVQATGRVKVTFGTCLGTNGDSFWFALPPYKKDANLHATVLFMKAWSIKTSDTPAARARTLWVFVDSGTHML